MKIPETCETEVVLHKTNKNITSLELTSAVCTGTWKLYNI
jgi:hypothetical protein